MYHRISIFLVNKYKNIYIFCTKLLFLVKNSVKYRDEPLVCS